VVERVSFAAQEFAGNLADQVQELLQQVVRGAEQLQAHSKPKTSRGPVLYTRLDYWNSQNAAGGSIGQTAHVILIFASQGMDIHVAAGFYLPLVDPARFPTTLLEPPDPKWGGSSFEVPLFSANDCMRAPYRRLVERIQPAFIYERPA